MFRTAVRISHNDEDYVVRVLARRRGCLGIGPSAQGGTYSIGKCSLSDPITLWLSANKNNIDVSGASLFSKSVYQVITTLAALDPAIRSMEIKSDSPSGPSVGAYLTYWKSSTDQLYLLRNNLVLFYHGTSTNQWSSIERQGLRPRKLTGSDPSYYTESISQDDLVYLATDDSLNSAFFAARSAAKIHGGQPLVLLVYSEGLDPAKLEPDEDSGEVFWWRSITKMGTVAYAGFILPKWLEPMYLYQDGVWIDILGQQGVTS